MKKWLLGLLVAGFLVRVAMIFFNPLESLGGLVGTWFMVDDSYYCLNIAKNIAEGNGWTHDGINQTNGFQPLYVFMMVPVYWLVGSQDLVTPVYIALLLLALFHTGCGWWTYRILNHLTRREWFAVLGAGIFLFSPNMIGIGINGMETAIGLFFLGWAFAYYLEGRPRLETEDGRVNRVNWQFWTKTGILLGLALWARLDSAILALVIGVDVLGTWKQRGWRLTLASGAILATVTIAIYSPFMVAGYLKVGSIIPESGKATRQLSWIRQVGDMTDRIPSYLMENLKQSVAVSVAEVPILPNVRMMSQANGDYFVAGENNLLINIPLLVLLIVILALYKRRGQLRLLGTSHQIILLYCISMIGIYSFYVFGDHYTFRYMHSVMWAGLILILAVVACLPHRVGKLFVVVFTLVFFTNMSVELNSMLVEDQGRNWGAMQLQSIKHLELKSDEKVGAFQSGYVSYWLDRRNGPVLNLDGVVNSRASKALRDRNLRNYLEEENVRYIVDWPSMVAMLDWGGVRRYTYRQVDSLDGIQTIELTYKGPLANISP